MTTQHTQRKAWLQMHNASQREVVNPLTKPSARPSDDVQESNNEDSSPRRHETAELQKQTQQRVEAGAEDQTMNTGGAAQLDALNGVREAKLSTILDLFVAYFQHMANILSINISWPARWFSFMKWIKIGSLGLEVIFDVQSEAAYWLMFSANMFFPLFLLFTIHSLVCMLTTLIGHDQKLAHRLHSRSECGCTAGGS